MQLVSIKYSEFNNHVKEWDLEDFIVNPINLIVGKNASGKTRTLNIINNLAKLIRGDLKPTYYASANFDAHFNHDSKNYRYVLRIENGAVVSESFERENEKLLTRSHEGVGKIFAEKLNNYMDFQTPPSEIALLARRDNIQHPYFEPLYEWASFVFHYEFGSPLGRDTFGLFRQGVSESDPKNTTLVVGIYKQGENKFGNSFKDAIKKDLKIIGYDISDIGLAPPSRIVVVADPSQGELAGLWIKEVELKTKTEQMDISQGMFRALSLVIQLNYSLLAHKPSCLIIDDIGEGLDFERSCSLIDLLLTKAQESKIQLIMATNDRFVMNKVPLEMWTVLHREGSHCKIFNIKNAKDKFESFRFTGLSNFDFFATDYLAENKK
jgi:energy-coupling factor transporter ATP-binding protein EcfA2